MIENKHPNLIKELTPLPSEFPKRLLEKLKAIREPYDLSAVEPLKSLDAATIESYKSGQLDLPVSVLHAYAKLAGIPIENLVRTLLTSPAQETPSIIKTLGVERSLRNG
jgi:hypothetical protein